MKIPAYLKNGDLIGIVSTASAINREVVEPAVALLRSLGYNVVLGQHVFKQQNQFAGTDEERSADLQYMIDHREVKAIICSRGGYGSLRTLQDINWESFKKYPKWLVGFSDVTVLHSLLNQMKIASIHGVMPRYFVDQDGLSSSFDTLLKALSGETIIYKITPSIYNRSGIASGELIGGNLSILYSLRGTRLDLATRGKILFIEDLSEYLYHLDRMMLNLKFGNLLSGLKGLIVGGFTGMKDNETPFGKVVEEIILDAVSAYDFPVIFDFPAGHQSNNFAMKLGCNASISVNNRQVLFQQ